MAQREISTTVGIGNLTSLAALGFVNEKSDFWPPAESNWPIVNKCGTDDYVGTPILHQILAQIRQYEACAQMGELWQNFLNFYTVPFLGTHIYRSHR